MTTALERRSFDPLRDKSYQSSRLGRSVVDFLAWKRLGGTAERTLLDYEWALARGCKLLPELALEQWTDADVLHVLGTFPAASRRERAAAYSGLFRWARLTRRIEQNPMELVPPFKRRGQRYIDVFTDAEWEALCGLHVRDGALMALLLHCGLRKGEARRLRLCDVKPDPAPLGQVVILSGKGGKDRVIPIKANRVTRMVAELSLLDGIGEREQLWYDQPGGHYVRRAEPIAETAFVRWWKRSLKQAGVRYRNPHVARHSFATRYLRRGGRLETLSGLMGHASIRTTFDLYGHLDTTDAAADLALVEGEG